MHLNCGDVKCFILLYSMGMVGRNILDSGTVRIRITYVSCNMLMNKQMEEMRR
jgi:hypothetical protein